MPQTLFRSQIILIAVILAVLLTTVSIAIPPGTVQTIFHVLRFMAWAAVTVTYLPAAAFALAKRRPDNVDYLIVGIVCAGTANAFMGGWSSFYRVLGKPPWMYENWVFNMLISVSIIGAFIHMLAPGANGGVPARGWVRAGVVVAAGCLAAVLLAWLGVSVTDF